MELKDHILKMIVSAILPDYNVKFWEDGTETITLSSECDSIILDLNPLFLPDHPVWQHAALVLNVNWQKVLALREFDSLCRVEQEIRKRGYRAIPSAALRHFILDCKLPNYIVHWNVLNKTEEFLKWLDEAKESCGIDLGGMIAFHSRLK